MHIIGYTFQAAWHCVACTQKYEFEINPNHPHASEGVDDHGAGCHFIEWLEIDLLASSLNLI